ncbi:MAG TPA: N-acetylglucosamine-6-phosphate deacetylase, partial [Hyphomonadaceae bacterium]|nr:N-acetylglucosamine-6-phosphate deacetylase [Hyphomonadaceae bacterium]
MNAIRFLNGRILSPAGPLETPTTIHVSGDRITCIDESPGDNVVDLEGGWLAPGLIDVQINGGGGALFNDAPTAETIDIISAAHLRNGVTGYLPTLLSDELSIIARGLDAVDEIIEAGSTQVLGIHVEGPFISPVRHGIHPRDNIRLLDKDAIKLLTAPRRGKVMVTLAPECCEPDQIAALVNAGVIVSLGHSNTSAETAKTAFALGARGVTHLFNAMSPLHHREPGLVGAALDTPSAWCGLIADGIHVDPVALRIAYRVKGADRLVLVSDAM